MHVGVRACSALAFVLVLGACDHGATHAGPASRTATSHSTPAQRSASPTSTTTPASGARETLREAWPIDANTVWAWTSTEGFTGPEHVLTSADGGTTWRDVTPAGLERLTRVRQIRSWFVLDARHAWLTYGGLASEAPQTLLNTGDGGRHWTRESGTPRPGCALDFVSPDRGWCVLDRATMGQDPIEVFGSSDGGTTWQRISRHGSPPVGCDKNVGFTTATLGWAVTACVAGTPPIYRTRDGGAHWTKTIVQLPGGEPDAGAEFSGLPVVAGGHAAVAFDLGEPQQTLIYLSIDGGDSWHPVRPPGPTSRWSVDIRTPDNWILIHANQLLSTNDGGRTWTRTTMSHRFVEISASAYDYAPAIYFPTRSIGWVRDVATSRLWRTTTAGRTWARIAISRT